MSLTSFRRGFFEGFGPGAFFANLRIPERADPLFDEENEIEEDPSAEHQTASRDQPRQDNLHLSPRHELDNLKDEFISTISHELRTPLTSIRGALGLLSSGIIGDEDAKAQNLLRIAVTNTDRLIRLINDILELERIESGRAPLQLRRCSLRDLCQQAIETMAPLADANAIHIELDAFVPTPSAGADAFNFDGDCDRILQVLTNLLSNSIKFSQAESTVKIHIDATGNAIRLKVVDEGRGIPVDKLDSVFERFQQVEPSDARQHGGVGLGLPICRAIVQQHKGSIWAERNPVKGTTLTVMLPCATLIADIENPERNQQIFDKEEQRFTGGK
jgi:signal transduction histidine kinase